MTPERLAEITRYAEAYKGTGLVRRRPNSAIAHRGELVAEIDRLDREFGKANARWHDERRLAAKAEAERDEARQIARGLLADLGGAGPKGLPDWFDGGESGDAHP